MCNSEQFLHRCTCCVLTAVALEQEWGCRAVCDAEGRDQGHPGRRPVVHDRGRLAGAIFIRAWYSFLLVHTSPMPPLVSNFGSCRVSMIRRCHTYVVHDEQELHYVALPHLLDSFWMHEWSLQIRPKLLCCQVGCESWHLAVSESGGRASARAAPLHYVDDSCIVNRGRWP